MTTVFFRRIHVFRGAQFLQQFFFSAAQMGGDPHGDTHELIAPAIAVEVGNSPFAHAQHSSGRSSRIDRQFCSTCESRDFDFSPECRKGKSYEQLVDNVIAVALKLLILLLLDDDEQVAGGTSPAAGIPLALQWNVVSFGNTCGNIDFDRGLAG
jgi:hypothetical protein